MRRKWIEIAIWSLLLGQLALSVYLYPRLPDPLPTHWNMRGEVDGYMSKPLGVGFPLALNLGIYLLLVSLPALDPKAKIEKFQQVLDMVRLFIHGLLTVIFVIALLNSLGYAIPVDKTVPALISLLFIFLGNYLGKLRPNYFIGIRTPWTLENEQVWQKTHRVSGPVWMGAGLVGLIGSFRGGAIAFGFFFGALMAATAFSLWYSWKVYQDLKGSDKH
ncbi:MULTISPECIES: SdpI family protein [Carboxydocella]|uniref:Uncharacterized membrane protein n=2 Tax=Carboxydocella TaxID=178898 RepID=A0A1T4NAU4_9FIRM|nr:MULTISPECIES: SdpI family protein [Carboxydocella]AVX20971.1 putative membrane protein [Carboxydocella thermautotrophica]GAW30976.1 integral membrane protein [Carboxydocella sp. JDF658]SJZ76399.1 Uncharacterized membrane protein [Carboxydocella sporoproducens DSM 16521]